MNQNNFIPVLEWNNNRIIEMDCLYGYCHKTAGYMPFHEITEVINIGKTRRWGIKGFDENGDKLYIQIFEKHQDFVREKNWIPQEKLDLL